MKYTVIDIIYGELCFMTDNSSVQMNPLASEPVAKLIAKFTIPAIISMVVSSIYNIVDQIFIGQGVGTLGNAATNIAFPLNIICIATALLLGIGGASNYNLRAGEGKQEEARYLAGNTLSMLVIGGGIIMAVVLLFLDPLLILCGSTEEIFPYARDYVGITAVGMPFLIITTGGSHLIRADRRPNMSMVVMLSGAIINTILDPVFIFACGWGIRGAAWATVIGQMFSGVLVLFYFAFRSNMRIERKMLVPRWTCLKRICALGMASCVNQISMAIVQVVMNNTLRKYGAISVYGANVPIAVVGIITKVNSLFMAIAIGISQGCQPIFGFNYGAKNYSRVRETYRKAATVAVIAGVVFFLCFQIFPRQLISLFGSGTEDYYRFAARYFRIFLFFTFLNGIQPMSSGFYTSIGKAKLGMIVALTKQILFLMPLILILPVFLGVDGVMFAGPIADGITFLVTVFFVVREIRIMKQQERMA